MIFMDLFLIRAFYNNTLKCFIMLNFISLINLPVRMLVRNVNIFYNIILINYYNIV